MAAADDKRESLKQYNDSLKEQLRLAKASNDMDRQRAIVSEQISSYERVITDLKKEQLDGTANNVKAIEDLQKEQKLLIDQEKEINDQLERQVRTRKNTIDLARQLGAQLKIGWKYLQDADKIIKSTNLNLGMSNAKAVAMRDAFEQSATYVTRLGGSIADISTVMQGYADETGRARAMSAEMVKDITDIGKGTGLGIEQATRLGAQFELMGYDAKGTMEYVQGVVDTSERMGVNTTKVLKVVNDNFKRLNTYTFQQGVKGFAEMAMYAEKFKIDINQALNAADVARSLEGAIDLTAQLQVMGGEFAKTDPFEMLFLARNDPAKFTEKIADMTKGVVSFRKMADGSFEKYISPADRDRLASVAESMGMEASALTEIAERQAEIQKMRNQMAGMGLSAEQKEIVEGAAIFNQKSGKFQVSLAGTMTDIGKLTKDQAKAFQEEQVLLKDRAKEAMTFDDTFKATIETLKATLLPLLKGVNFVLDKFIKPMADLAAKGWGGAAVVAASLTAAGLLWKGVTSSMGRMATKWVGEGGGTKRFIGGALGGKSTLASGIPATGAGKSGLAMQRAGIGAGAASKGAGISKMGTGVAAAGMGAGVMLAAKGIGELAEKMKELDGTQIWALPATVLAMSVSFFALAPAITAAGAAGTIGAVGILAIGAAMVGIGFGINLATKGIGEMATGLGNMIESSKGAGPAMLQVGAGIGAISLAMMGFTAGALGFLTFAATMKTLSKHAPAMAVVGDAFKNIQTVLSGSRDDFIAVENAVKSISGANIRGGGYFSELANLLKKPLQVEFANNGKLYLDNDITLQIDGEKFMRKVYKPEIAVQMHENLKHGKGS